MQFGQIIAITRPQEQAVPGFPVNRSYTKAESDARYAPAGGTGFVPYIGATSNVDIGGNSLSASSLSATGLNQNSVLFAGASGLISQDNSGFNYIAATGLHVGLPAGTSNSFLAGYGMEVVGSDNTLAGVNLIVGNISNGTKAFADIYFQNDLSNGNGLTHFAVLNYSSSTYNDATFGTILAQPNQLALYGIDGNTLIGSGATNGYVGIFTGGTATTNERGRFTNVGLGMNTTAPTALVHGVAKATRGAAVFTGSGLNNLTASGSYTGDTQLSSYKVVIALVNGPFTGSVNANGTGYVVGDLVTILTGGANHIVRVSTINGSGGVTAVSVSTQGSGYTTGIKATTGGTGTGFTYNITALRDFYTWQKDSGTVSAATASTGASQTLAEGVAITFAATTGHTVNDLWTIPVDSTDAFKADDALGNNLFRVSNGNVYANRIFMTRGAPGTNGYFFNVPGIPSTGASSTGMWMTASTSTVIIGASGVAGVSVAAGLVTLSNAGAGGTASVTLSATGVAISHLMLAASTTTIPSLNIASGTAPTAPVTGDIWNDSTQNMLAFSNGNTLYQSGNLYTAAAAVTITSTSPVTTLSGTKIGTTTIKANTLKVGQKFAIWGAGYYSTPLANTSTVTITVKIGSVTVSTVTTGALPASATNLPFLFNLQFTVRSIGASATLVCDGSFDYNTALSGIVKTSNSLSTVGTITFDSTVDEAMDVQASWSAVTTQTATVQQSKIDFL